MTVGAKVGQVVSESFGIICLTTGVSLIQAGDYVTGIFLIVVGLACLFAEKYIGE